MIKKPDDWRDDSSISIKLYYRRHFAIFPKRLSDKTWIWLQHYYCVWQRLYYRSNEEAFRAEKTFPRFISEEEYVFKKIAGTLGR